LAASRFYLDEHLKHPEAVKAEQEMNHYLYHNELGLALECAADLGALAAAPSEYWRELQLAAEEMGLAEDAVRLLSYQTRRSSGPLCGR